ncbi:MAG: spermidine/putrescine ABC transporter substrate-binding protein [Ruminococcaceae bacterium]|nr:spermidine/putrescine ABC transporter substrate-binding protein [Oscillospiraceae bacterium]
MKRTVCVILCLIMLILPLSLAGCSTSEFEGEINVYNWGEYISNGDDGTLDVIDEFEKKYKIKVNYTNFETNEEMYNILSNSNSSYDVIIPSDYMVSRLREEGMLEKIDFENVPNYKNIMDKFKTSSYDPTGEYSVAYSWGIVALAYNKKMIEEGSVKGFSSLWDEENKGKILMFNNSRDAMAIAMQLCDPPIDPGSSSFTTDDIDEATNKLIEQKPLLKKYVMDQVFTEMESSQAAIAPYYAGDIYTMMLNNEDLTYCLPQEGSNLFVDAMCIPTCCQNKEYAELFINFMCDPIVAKANAEYIGYATPNSEAHDLLDDEIKNCELIYPPDDYVEKCYTFSNIPNDIYVYMQEKFVKACSSSAEVTDIESDDAGSNIIYTIIVCILLAIIIIATITMLTLNIIRAVKNRGRIQKR